MTCVLDHCRAVAEVRPHHNTERVEERRVAGMNLQEWAVTKVQRSGLPRATEEATPLQTVLSQGPVGFADLYAGVRSIGSQSQAFRLPNASVAGQLAALPILLQAETDLAWTVGHQAHVLGLREVLRPRKPGRPPGPLKSYSH